MRMVAASTLVLAAWLVGALAGRAHAGNAVQPVGEPVLEPPTLHCLGVYWIVTGDDNQNATVTVAYRPAGTTAWLPGAPLFRVEKGAHQPEKFRSKLDVPADGWLFAGSVVLLQPGTDYELRLTLSDPDGGNAQKVLPARTLTEPLAPAGMRTRHVIPGNPGAGGGSGSLADPFRGLDAAQAAAQPGDLFLLHAGVYPGTFTVKASGETGKPIIWRGVPGMPGIAGPDAPGEAVIDAQAANPAGKRPGRAISATDLHDVWFEKLTLRHADYGIVAHRSHHVVVRRCHIVCDYGFTCTNNSNDAVGGMFLADNTIEGPCTWPRTKGIEDPRGIQITGTGNVVCYNAIRGFSDAMDTFPSPRCSAIDFHNNDCYECTDDGSEMDYSERNTRNFHNRYTNCFQGVSVQPVFGGPVYVFRNVLYNVVQEPFKLHNSPSGALFYHNTVVKKGVPLILSTNEKVRHCVLRNNLFIGSSASAGGTAGSYAYETTAPMADCNFDYDGFGGGPWGQFLKWNNVRYKTLDEVHAKAPAYKHAVLVDAATAFASGARPPEGPDAEKKVYPPASIDLRLKPGSAAVDAGDVLPGFNDGFTGKAPDLGAYELGDEMPHYGPRAE